MVTSFHRAYTQGEEGAEEKNNPQKVLWQKIKCNGQHK